MTEIKVGQVYRFIKSGNLVRAVEEDSYLLWTVERIDGESAGKLMTVCVNALPVDIEKQFEKLMPSFKRHQNIINSDKLYLINREINALVSLSQRKFPSHAYDINRLIALRELRDAIKAQMEKTT